MQPNSDTAKPVGAELLEDAKNVGASAANSIHSEVDARKGEAVTQVQAVSSTIERAAEGLDPNAPTWLKSALEKGAQQVKTFADTLDQNDSRQMVNQASDFAKRSPGTFLGACAAAGFAAARIFKAGGEENLASPAGAFSPDQSMPPVPSDLTNPAETINPSPARGEFV